MSADHWSIRILERVFFVGSSLLVAVIATIFASLAVQVEGVIPTLFFGFIAICVYAIAVLMVISWRVSR